MRSLATAVVVALAAGTLAAACSSKDAGAAACFRYGRSAARHVARCQGPIGNVAELEARFRDVCDARLDAPGTSRGLGDAFDRCGASLDEADCKDAEKLVCVLPEGTLAEGAACLEGFQCASGYCQVTEQTPDCGRCAAATREGEPCATDPQCGAGRACVPFVDGPSRCARRSVVALGDACDAAARCGAGLVCSEEGVCVLRAPVGAPCRTSTDCKDALRCDEAGRCAARGALGATCSVGSCAEALACDLQIGTCQRPVAVSAGAACDATRLCRSGECVGYDVRSDEAARRTVVTPGTCRAFIPEGGACGPQIAGSCQVLAACVDGVCRDPSFGSCSGASEAGPDVGGDGVREGGAGSG